MAKWSDYGDMGAATIADADTFVVRDVSDTTLAATGTQKEYPWSVMKTDISTTIFAALNADNITIDGNTISTTSGNLNITPVAGSNITLDGTIAVDAGVVTGITSLGVTGTRVTKVWATDVESTNMPTIGGTAVLSSLTAPQFTTIELSHASANTLSASSGVLSVEGVALPRIIASGTSALNTAEIASANHATVVTTTATGAATTDVIIWNFNADPHGVTGYVPSADGSLFIYAYPTSGNVNFLVMNNTAGAITPGAITLNWMVVR